MFHSHAESFLAQVRSLKDAFSGSIDSILVLLSQLLGCIAINDHELLARDDDLLIDVLNESLDKWCANLLDPLFQPDIIVKELSFAGQNTKIDRKVIVITVNYLDETVFDLLSDI